MRRSVAALFKPKGKWMYDTKNVSETHRQKRLEKYESLSDQEAKSYRKREMRGKAPDDSESYWDIVPTEFRTETVMMQATGAGFNSIFEDRNPRSLAGIDTGWHP
ncbi:hypothetical protein DIPPA_11097 [Diplonema papillatum]|nr:hypothetical protein DIPPA_11097 [Diplonema papillatum]